MQPDPRQDHSNAVRMWHAKSIEEQCSVTARERVPRPKCHTLHCTAPAGRDPMLPQHGVLPCSQTSWGPAAAAQPARSLRTGDRQDLDSSVAVSFSGNHALALRERERLVLLQLLVRLLQHRALALVRLEQLLPLGLQGLVGTLPLCDLLLLVDGCDRMLPVLLLQPRVRFPQVLHSVTRSPGHLARTVSLSPCAHSQPVQRRYNQGPGGTAFLCLGARAHLGGLDWTRDILLLCRSGPLRNLHTAPPTSTRRCQQRAICVPTAATVCLPSRPAQDLRPGPHRVGVEALQSRALCGGHGHASRAQTTSGRTGV